MPTVEKKRKWFFLFLVVAAITIMGFSRQSFAGEAAASQFYLVSVGVGDADLITLRAINTIKASDVIICGKNTEKELAEYLSGKTIIDGSGSAWRTYRNACDRIDDPEKKARCLKGKESRKKLISEIRAAIADGKTVSVIGSGDLLIYGGPYHWYQREFADLNPKVIPGISCFNAANAAIGKEIMSGGGAVLTTLRGIDKLAGSHPTMVIFTMFTEFEKLVEKLKSYYPPETPIAVVFHAGYKEKEHVVKGRLNTILKETKDMKFPFEHLVYVGNFMDENRQRR